MYFTGSSESSERTPDQSFQSGVQRISAAKGEVEVKEQRIILNNVIVCIK